MAIGNSVSPQAAANAYSNLMNIGKASETTSSKEQGVSFSEFLQDGIRSSIDTIKEGEKMSAQAITGQANLTDVVQAVASAEMSLQTIVALRDKIIGAYQDIMRMPI